MCTRRSTKPDACAINPAVSSRLWKLAIVAVATSLADLAVASSHTGPTIDRTLAFKIVRGRHPVVEAALASDHARPFVPNDSDLATKRLWLVTGPNMAGKSTFLRQNAL